MDGIGIVQWRDQGESYPFQNAGKFTGILCDASFLSFNGVIPVLQQLKLTPDSLTLTVLTYNGALDFVVAIANAIPDAKAVLRYNNIYYGSVVFGANIVDVTSGNYGTKIATKLSFSPITVRMLNSQAGLYSINGLSGDLIISLDSNMWYDSGVLNAVSIPISSNVVVPLKTINSLGCTDNNLNILGTDEVVVSGAGNNTLVIQLPVADANLNVVRSTTYV